ncbi:MAG: hypothetical protein JKY87_00645, partial [Mariprofundus sp.]|nr:hypothetical protein [Mariprofundus sp.]
LAEGLPTVFRRNGADFLVGPVVGTLMGYNLINDTTGKDFIRRKLDDSASHLNDMLRFAECGVHPALTLWFDVPVAEAMRRMQLRVAAGEKATRLDDEAVSFHQRVAAAFARQHQLEIERIVRIDAGQDMDAVEKQVATVLENHFSALSL